MKTKKYPIIVLCITLLLILASLVLTFIGAFKSADGLFKTGITGLIFVPIIGWVMVSVYNRVHREDVTEAPKQTEGETNEET